MIKAMYLPGGSELTHWGRDKWMPFHRDIFKRIFLNENNRILIKISLKFVPKVPINNIPALVQVMAWRWPGDKPLSVPMMVCLLTHMCVTRPQWVKTMYLPGGSELISDDPLQLKNTGQTRQGSAMTQWGWVTHMCHQPRPSLVEIMAFRLAGPKPLSEPMLEYC